MQSRRHSLIEATLNTLSGLIIAVVAGHFIYPLFGWHPSWGENIVLTLLFTVISVVRSYAWRRLFNWIHHGRALT